MRVWQVLIAVDQLANALAGGWADETLSARAHRCQASSRRWAWLRRGIDALFFWDADHCFQAWISERARMQLPVEYRN